MAHSLSPKQEGEQAAFARFARLTGQGDLWIRIVSRPEPEPDLLCTHADVGEIAFELVRLVDPVIAQVVAARAKKARTDAFWTSDPSERIIRDKLGKAYTTNAKHIELLIYTDGRILTPDDAIIPSIAPWFDAVPQHPFKRAWFMGEHITQCVWSAG